MILSDVLNDLSTPLFEQIDRASNGSLDWMDYQILDTLYLGHSGSKEISPFLEVCDRNRLGQTIVLIYGKRWKKLSEVLSMEYNPIANYNVEEIVTPDLTKSKEVKTSTDYTVTDGGSSDDKYYGFNSVTPSPVSKDETTSTSRTQGDADKNTINTTETESGTKRVDRNGNTGFITTQDMLRQEIDLWKWDFYETIFKMLDDLLTIDVY